MPELNVLPPSGLITVPDLSEFLRLNQETVLANLVKNNIPILHLSRLRRGWFVRLEDLRKKEE